jgi:hypothetical protein
VKTGSSLAEFSKEGYGSKRAVVPMMMNYEKKRTDVVHMCITYSCWVKLDKIPVFVAAHGWSLLSHLVGRS